MKRAPTSNPYQAGPRQPEPAGPRFAQPPGEMVQPPGAPGGEGQDDGFSGFMDRIALQRHVVSQGLVPLWAKPDLAQKLLAQHMSDGSVLPHPDIGDIGEEEPA